MFDSQGFCAISGTKIESLEEANLFEGKLYHKCNSPRFDFKPSETRKRNSVNTSIEILMPEGELQFDKPSDLISFLSEYIADRIDNDKHDIERLELLEFIGEAIQLFGGLKSTNGKSLYIQTSGSRSDIISNLKQLVSLFSFTKNIKIE